MIQIDSLRNTMNPQGLSRQSFDSSDSNCSSVSSPGSVTYHSLPAVPTPGDSRSNGMLSWPQGGASYTGDENSDDEEEYRPFTPPPPRERLSYTRYQLELLNAIYNEVKYPNSTQKQLIAKRAGITRDQVKIWFQNRRRKDVVGKQKSEKEGEEDKTSDSQKPKSPTPEGETSNTEKDSKSEKPEDDSDETVLPPLVRKSVIAELKRFEKDPLKNKNKKKSKKRPAPSQAVGPKPPQPMFQAYDMISPPNRVTPSAFFTSAANRFNHSKSSSAFHNPRDSKHPMSMVFPGQSSFLPGVGHPPSASSISVYPNDYVNPPNTTAPPSSGHSLYESIPVLADLLGYRTHVDVTRQREHSLHHPHVPTQCSTMSATRSPDTAPETAAPPTQSAMGLNRVFPFPFIADPPVMLSSIRHSDPYRPQLHYQPPSYSDEPYQPLVISSLSNPYFSSTPPSSWAGNQNPTDTSVTSSSYSQL